MNRHPTDPPLLPFRTSTTWFETGPEPILDDLNLAVLIVRIGLASNALSAQLHAARDAGKRRAGAARMRDILCSFITTAAFTNEAIDLARAEMPALRGLAQRGGADLALLARVGKLCAGKHPAAEVLRRARNKIGFHWDKHILEPAVADYSTNKKIVWLEMGANGQTVHRLAVEVLAHVLFPSASDQTEQTKKQTAVVNSMAEVHQAMRLIVELFTASLFGYLALCETARRTRSATKRTSRAKPERRDNTPAPRLK